MKAYFGYTRVSTTKQGRGYSLQEQKSAIEAHAAREGIVISAWFTEMETAARHGRREFARMLSELRRGRAAGVIMHKIDRGARNLRDWSMISDLADAGVDVQFAHERMDLKSRGGRLAADIQAVVAADYVRNLRDEIRKGFYGCLKRGLYPLPAPRGYVNQGKGRPKAVDPVQGPLVRQAFALYESGRYGLEGLSGEMHRRGLRTARGGKLSRSAIAGILHNPFYVGLIRIRTTSEVFKGCHSPLVSVRQFERVQKILSGRLFARPQRHEFMLRRMVRCRKCGRVLTGEWQKGRAYYRCHSEQCRGTSLSEENLKGIVRRELACLSLDDGDVRDFRDIARLRLERERSNRDANLEAVKRDIAHVDERLVRLTDAVIDLTIDKETFNARKATLLTDRQRLVDVVEGRADALFWERVLEKFELGLTALHGFNSGSPDEKREIVSEVSSNFWAVGKDGLLELDFPYREVREWAGVQNCGPSRAEVRTVEGLVAILQGSIEREP